MEAIKKQNPKGPRLFSEKSGTYGASPKGNLLASYGVNFLQWFSWQFLEAPKEILKGWKNFLKFNLNYFSIPLLLKTFFSLWHKYQWRYPRRFDIGKYLEVFFSNLISRALGAIMRFFLIIIGILVEIFIFFAGLIILLVWLILPIFLIFGLYYGFRILL